MPVEDGILIYRITPEIADMMRKAARTGTRAKPLFDTVQPGRLTQTHTPEMLITLRAIAVEFGADADRSEVIETARKTLCPQLFTVLALFCGLRWGISRIEQEMKLPARSAKVLLAVAVRQALYRRVL